MGIREEVTAALQYEGRPYIDHNGRQWEMTTETDEASSIMAGDDGDWFGRLEFAERSSLTGHYIRPDGMNGRARILRPNQCRDAFWWMPPADVADEDLSKMAATLDDILSYGYCGIVVTTDDGYSASLWGIEPFPSDEMTRATVEDLVIEILCDIERAAIARAREVFTLESAIR